MKDSGLQNGNFKTSDIDVAAFLLSNRQPMAGLIREGDHLLFAFTNVEQCQGLAQRYLCGDDAASAKALLSASKHLRRLVRENL